MKIITGKLAQYMLSYILNDFEDRSLRIKTPAVAGYFKEGDVYICFDNTSWNCWTEETTHQELALKWCLGEIETEGLVSS